MNGRIKLISYAIMTVLVGSMGIYFLTAYMDQQRVEVSIEKTLIEEEALKEK